MLLHKLKETKGEIIELSKFKLHSAYKSSTASTKTFFSISIPDSRRDWLMASRNCCWNISSSSAAVVEVAAAVAALGDFDLHVLGGLCPSDCVEAAAEGCPVFRLTGLVVTLMRLPTAALMLDLE